MAQLARGVEAASERYLAELARWRQRRVAAVAKAQGVPVEQVTPALVGFHVALHGEPVGPAPRPRIDGRYGPRVTWPA